MTLEKTYSKVWQAAEVAKKVRRDSDLCIAI
jgi:hypothetical protein